MDTIADFLIRLKNSALAGRQNLMTPFSGVNHALAKILLDLGFLEKVEIVENSGKKGLSITLPKAGGKISAFEVKRISKPGKRVYLKAEGLRRMRGLWTVIVSTPSGLMEAKKALKLGHGGEVICKIMKI